MKFGYNVKKWPFALLPHVFNVTNTVLESNGDKMSNYLSTEIDFTMDYAVHKYINVTIGYSQMFATDTMQRLKGGDVNHTNNWAWIMVNVNLQIFSFK